MLRGIFIFFTMNFFYYHQLSPETIWYFNIYKYSEMIKILLKTNINKFKTTVKGFFLC
jgi:hypothetical protein